MAALVEPHVKAIGQLNYPTALPSSTSKARTGAVQQDPRRSLGIRRVIHLRGAEYLH
jgi:hypothetical protein